MKQLLPGYEIRPLKDFMSLMTSSNLPGLGAFINIMIAIAVAIGFLVIFLSMYTTIIERTREIGVLKSLGRLEGLYCRNHSRARRRCFRLVGIAAGVGLSFLLRSIFVSVFPSMTILITPRWILIAAGIAIAGGPAGRLLPGLDRQPQGSRRSAGLRIGCFPWKAFLRPSGKHCGRRNPSRSTIYDSEGSTWRHKLPRNGNLRNAFTIGLALFGFLDRGKIGRRSDRSAADDRGVRL